MSVAKSTLLSALPLIAGVMAFGALPKDAAAQQLKSFEIYDHSVGQSTTERELQGLYVEVHIRRTGLRISGADRSEICANFHNVQGSPWTGGYRLTDRYDESTHASLRVESGDTVTRCETLNPQREYNVVLRQD